jgi:hypothetical protein
VDKRRRNFSPFIQALALFLTCGCFAVGQDTHSTEFWPEVDIYERLSEHARLLFSSAVTSGRTADEQTMETGAFIDIFVPRFKPVLFRRLSEADESRAKRIVLRAGYLYVFGDPEHRLQTDATFRWVLHGNILATDRNRAEYRFIRGNFSWRYRNDFRLEHDIAVSRRPLTAYMGAELFYDSRYDTLSRWRYRGGAALTLNKKWLLELYYVRQVTKHADLSFVNSIGFAVSFFGP